MALVLLQETGIESLWRAAGDVQEQKSTIYWLQENLVQTLNYLSASKAAQFSLFERVMVDVNYMEIMTL